MGAVKQPHAGQFKPGNRFGGRPLGSRNRLSEAMLADLREHWELHGKAVLDEVRNANPVAYLNAMVQRLPREMKIEKLSPLGELTDEELDLLMEYLAAARAKVVRKIERLDGTTIVLEPDDTKQARVMSSYHGSEPHN